jgi:protein phosphatase/serine/threonine-protein phosphatase Stp1
MMQASIDYGAMTAWRFRSSAATHAGAVRRHNEDGYVNRPDLGLWAVADGAGGHQAGEVASRLIVDMLEAIPAGFDGAGLLAEVRRRLVRAHDTLGVEAARRGPGAILASTVVVLLARDDYYACLWAGDSRAYLLRGGRFRQLTRDHSLVQELFDAGAISAEEAAHHPSANIITRAVGTQHLELDKVTDRLYQGDRFLLCSDGLFKTVADRQLAGILSAEDDATAARLLTAALAERADDNLTAVTIEVLADPAQASATSRDLPLQRLPFR